MSNELKLKNRAIYFRKSISSPLLGSESVLTNDPFQFVELWLKRHSPDAIPYWLQAWHYYKATKNLPVSSSPLTAYYCFLNATKALLTVKKIPFREWHGVTGNFDPTSKRNLSNEIITIKGSGVVSALTNYLSEPEQKNKHTLSDILGNLPFIHRTYRHTFVSKAELFVPIRNLHYRKHKIQNKVWLSGRIDGRFADNRSTRTFPNILEQDSSNLEFYCIRSKTKKKWYKGNDIADKNAAILRLRNLHRKCRIKLAYISAPQSLWYVKRNHSSSTVIDRYGMTLIISAMHRLSELARYDPKGLAAYFDGQANWLLSEFISLASDQFIDELVCEMTGLEFRLPGVRP